VHGPRVVVTEGVRTIDDTALPLEHRRALARHRAALDHLEAARSYELAVNAEKRAREEAGLL